MSGVAIGHDRPGGWLKAVSISCLRVVGVLITTVAALLAVADHARADVTLETSTPADGSSIGEPVEVIKLHFARTAEPVGGAEGMQIFDASGRQLPAVVSPGSNGELWDVTPDAPLENGSFGLRWAVTAADGHHASGTLRFTAGNAASIDEGVAVPPPVPASTLPDDQNMEGHDMSGRSDASALMTTDAMDAAMSEQGVAGVGLLAGLGRWITYLGTLLAVGGLVFVRVVMRGDRSSIGRLFGFIRLSGGIALAGVVLQLAGQAASLDGESIFAVASPEGLITALGSWFGFVMLVAGVGAFFVLDDALPAARFVDSGTHSPIRSQDLQSSMASSRGSDHGSTMTMPRHVSGASADSGELKPNLARSQVAVLGGGLLIAAAVLEGHSNSIEPKLLVALAAAVHLLAAAVWVGGLAALAVVMFGRARQRQPLGIAALIVRFSTAAGVAAVAAGAAGLLLAFSILEQPADLWATSWGRVLLLKLLLVGTVAGIGSYNHFKVIPAIEAGVPGAQSQLGRTLKRELVVMLAVVGLTAWLVGSAA